MPALAETKRKKSPRAQDIDRYVGARLRERRLLLGMTQQQMAELIGVTYQQAHKYERGINRISGGRLYEIARALGVEINYLFEGFSPEARVFEATLEQQMLLELTRNFINISSRQQQEAICSLARAIANSDSP